MINEKGIITKLLFGIILLIIGIIIVFILIQNVRGIYETVDSDTIENYLQVLLINNGTLTSLTPIGEGITSLTATRSNQSWLEFDGVNDYVNASKLEILVGTNWSVSGWFIWRNNSVSTQLLLSNSFNSSNKLACGTKGSHGKFICAMSNGTSGKYWSSSRTDSVMNQANQWHHFVWVSNSSLDVGSYGSLYFDGILQSGASNVGSGSSQRMLFGGGSWTYYWNGAIDEVRIYNRSITETEISEIYNSGRTANASLPSDGLVLWYSFNEGSGTTIYDKSGNGNNGE